MERSIELHVIDVAVSDPNSDAVIATENYPSSRVIKRKIVRKEVDLVTKEDR